jgi:hypothetical protein
MHTGKCGPRLILSPCGSIPGADNATDIATALVAPSRSPYRSWVAPTVGDAKPQPRDARAPASLLSGRLRRRLRRRNLVCHRLTRLRRILRRLIGLLVRSRLVRLLHRSLYLIPGRMQFLVKVFSRFAKFVHALPQAPGQFRKFFGTEQYQYYHQN